MRKLTILFAFLLLSFAVYAQEGANTLTYGDSMTGEITNRNFEVEYSFQGSAGDVIVVELIPDDTLDGLSQPSIIILNSEFDVLASVDAGISAAVLVYELGQDGEYFILATRRDGRSGESIGPYTLELSLVPLLEPSQTMQGSVTSEQPAYYAVKSTVDFNISYERGDGDFYPAIEINVIEDQFFSDDNLESIATLEGDSLKRGTIGINVEGSGQALFIVTISEPLFQFNLSEKSVDFTVEMTVVSN